ncbi:MAG: hypothetical protein R6U50_06320 [Desulfobacterales bacterium]
MKKLLKDIDDSKKVFKDMGMNKWREVNLPALKKGDRFRVYTKVGRPLELGGEETLVAHSDAYQVDGVWTIEVKAS